MLSGVYRRSPRIVELDARKAQARSQNKGNVICEVADEEEPEKGQDILNQKRRRKKVKARTVQDLVNSVEYKVQKTDSGNEEDGLVKNDAIVPSGAAIPEKGKLELLLGILQRRDTYKIFAEPVNPEEVEHYYDVIKEPMDFGTIAKKLNEGSYQTLENFEHDVFLVPNNAMLFNASNTIYYRQARALKELATKLFHALKTDPESFESDASLQRMGLGRRTNAGVGILNCNNKSNASIAARGYRAHGRFNDVDVERRQTYRPWKSLLSENGSLVSAVYNSPKPLVLNAEADIGYLESLKRFSKDLGPVAQNVAMKKVNSYISEAMRVWNVTTNRQVWPPNMQIPNAPSASNIKVAPSFKVPSSTLGCQNISVDKMNLHSGFSHGGQAPMDDNMTINNALTGGISQPGVLQGNMIPSVSRGGFAPSSHLLGDSSGYQTLAGETMDGPTFFRNRGKVTAGYNVDMIDSFKDYAANKSNEIQLESSFPNHDSGKPKLDLSALWNTKGKQKESGETSMMVNPINEDNSVQNAEHASSWWRMQECLPQSNSGASSSAWCPPSQVMTGLNGFQTIDYMTGIGSHYPDKAMCEKDVIADGQGSRYKTNVEHGGVVSDLLSPLQTGMQSQSGLGSHYPDKAMCEKDVIADGQGSKYKTNVEHGGVVSDLLSPLQTGMQSQCGIGSHYPGKAICEKDVLGDGEGGVVSDLLKPLEMGMQSTNEFCFREETLPAEMTSIFEQKELEPLCELPTDEDWIGVFPEENEMNASEKALEYEWFEPESSGAAAERRLKQTAEKGTEQAQWRWL
ncbi:uncharacterized protein LOC120175814 isoform X1 [Hibiscus syriacus]|uniref:uncharacterized protein LOC120175814 isoform X1 n=1 Tax=Hibiscus syriacus TaxID=106335 RepID=UPI0019232530|nr:uncharacterized protein LOC120175814 isoform X1 [Hibiscus syriacus]